MRFIDLTGQKFGRLTVLRRAPNRARITRWVCECECGATTNSAASSLRNGDATSCGCRQREVVAARNHKHGLTKTAPLYKTWLSMRGRCNNPNSRCYSRYGGRGITVCARWDSFETFLHDMGPRPTGCSLDRIDVNGNYEPGNCRWATSKQQFRNLRKTLYVTYRGERISLCDLYEREAPSIQYMTFVSRVKTGWDIRQAINSPLVPRTQNRKNRAVREATL